MAEAKVAVVIPCYKVAHRITEVLRGLPQGIANIIVIDDACPEASDDVAEALGIANLTVLRNPTNMGVGGAVIEGYKKALELGADVVVKMDGDNQMNPEHFWKLATPVIEGRADYAKGNRFRDFSALMSMPALRLFGNSVLSFMVKVASGYWDIVDPTNGYTAINRDALGKLKLERIARRYFFESDMLLKLYLIGAVVEDVDIPARYGDEASSLSVTKVLFQFPPRLLRGLIKRVLLRYFIYDFNMASVYMFLGIPLMGFGMVFGTVTWLEVLGSGVTAPLGTIMLAALPVILGLEMLLQAVNIDIANTPRRKL